MIPERHARSVELFSAAVELPPEERLAFLDRACAEPALRAEVASLLAHDAQAAALDASPVGAVLNVAHIAATACLPPAPLPGRIGRFQILAQLGTGGMGIVYRARQDPPGRVVALKLIRPDLASHESRRRFQTEVETLARLRHPGVAAIYEAGTLSTAAGERPYMAMELVEGQPIAAYAAARGLDVRGRVRLLIGVCDAIEHAHQRGVIHRDLKPANILVEEDASGHPRPRVLDFGVARLRDPHAAANMTLTAPGQLLGTLAYMSPEQLDGDPHEVDTRTDVYALGAIAYELLGGRVPVELPRSSFGATLAAVKEETPPALSRLQRACRGDLERIVAKALAKDRRQRYGSAAALGDDLRCFLAGQPVGARPATLGYVFRKYAARHRVIVAAGAVALAGLLAGLAGTGYGLVRARQATGELERQARETIDAATFLVDRVSADLDRVAGTAEVRRALLDRLSVQVDDLLQRRPHDEQLLATRATVWSQQADLALSERRIDETDALRQKVLALRRQLLAAAPHAADRQAAFALALIKVGDVHKWRGELVRARTCYEQALAVDESLARAHPGVRLYLDNVGWGYDRLGDIEIGLQNLTAAERFYERRLAVNEELLAIDPSNLITHYGIWEAHHLLAGLASQRGLTEQATAEARAGLVTAELLLRSEPHNRRYGHALINSSLTVALYLGNAAPEEAARLVDRALLKCEQLLALDPADGVAQSLIWDALERRARIAAQRGQHGRAAQCLERLIELHCTDRLSAAPPAITPPERNAQLAAEAARAPSGPDGAPTP